MRSDFCEDVTVHPRHVWRPGLFRRFDCPGVQTVTPCGKSRTHGWHWHGEYYDEMCQGAGLAAVCGHGVGMLDECRQCGGDRTPDVVRPPLG